MQGVVLLRRLGTLLLALDGLYILLDLLGLVRSKGVFEVA